MFRCLFAWKWRFDAQAEEKAGAGMVCGVLTGKLDESGLDGSGATGVIGSMADLPQRLLKS